jgi:hypothetical protein
VTSAGAARAQPSLTIRLHDGRVTVRPGEPRPRERADATEPRLFDD